LQFEAYSETEEGNILPLKFSNSSSESIQRQHFSFYRISPVPVSVSESIGPDGMVKHGGDVDVVRQLGASIRKFEKHCSITVSPEAERLIQSAESPILADICPKVDFGVEYGTLKASLDEVLQDKSARPASFSNLNKPHLVSGSFCEFTLRSRDLIEQLTKLGTAEGENVIQISGKDVPSAVEILRRYPLTQETPEAKGIKVHYAPLQSRSFLELEDPETLIVTQRLETADGRQVAEPELPGGGIPEWIRIRSEYFNTPDKLAKSPAVAKK
jgi:hypothetical protein